MSQDQSGRPAAALAAARATVVFVIALLGAGFGLHLPRPHAAGASRPAAPGASPGTPVPAASLAPAGPAATVQAYVAAVNQHDDRRAWDLGGDHLGWSYGDVAAGLAGTARDILRVLSVRGDTVTADLTVVQANGTRSAFRDTYTVAGATITSADIQGGS